MKTMIEKFHESEYGKNPDYCIAFYLGILCSIISQRDHRFYVDKFIKEGLINFRKFEDMKKLNVAIERFLLGDDGESKVYREKVSNYFLQTTGENFDPDTAVMILGVGMSIRNPLESVLTFSEATEKWGLGHSTLREAAKHSRFLPGEIRKSGGTWLVTEKAMKRLYGEPKGGKNMQYYRKNNTFF